MLRIWPIAGLGLFLCSIVPAQTPPPATITLTLEEALLRAATNSQQLLSADIAARIAHEDRVQAKAAMLPSLNWENGFTYTQPNGTDTGIFVANNGPRVYANQAAIHADYSAAKRADHQIAIAAESIARAKVEIAQRGLKLTVVQNYYVLVAALRHFANAQRATDEATRFLDTTRKQEAGGEAAHSDVVKAQIEANNRQRDLREAQLAIDKARIGFAVLLFSDFRQDFQLVDDLDKLAVLPPFQEVEPLATRNNPDVRAAQALVQRENYGIKSARSGFYPTLSLDYFYGIQSNQYALHNPLGQNNLGSSLIVGVQVPVWNWGAVSSRVKQAELRAQQAKVDLTLAQRQLMANLNAFYLEAATANTQMILLKESLDLAEESLKLTLLRYEAGEVTVLEVVDAQRTVIDARNAYDDGKARYRVGVANLQTVTGVF